MEPNFSPKSKDFLIFLFFACFWVSLVSLTGTLSSGYHLTDNHEFVKLHYGIEKDGLWKTFIGFERYFFQYRFAPTGFSIRPFIIKIFHLNFFYLSVVWLLVTIITSCLFYKIANTLGFKKVTAILFTLFIQVGAQSAFCWKLGLGENWGLFFLSFALFFLSKFYLSGKKIFDWLFLVFIILTAGIRESFYVIGPVAVLVRLYLITVKQNITFIQAIKQSKLFLAVITSYYLFHFYIAFLVIGINNVPGAFKAEFNLVKWAGFLARDLIVKIIAIGLVLLLVSKKVKITYLNNNKPLTDLIYIGVLCLLIILPQLFIYSNLGIRERYYVPFTIGLSIVAAYILDQLYDKKWLYYVYLSILILGIAWQTRIAYNSANEFAYEGKNSNNWIKKAFESTNEESNFLLVTEPLVYSEWNNSVQIYFNLVGKRKNIYSTEAATLSGLEKLYKDGPLVKSYYDTYNILYKNMKFREQTVIPEIKCVLIFPSLEQDFLNKNTDWFKLREYARYEYGDFVLYSQK